MKHAVGSILIWSMVLVGPGAAVAAETVSEHGAYRLGEIVVTAAPESGVESVGTVRRVTAEEIRNQGARTLDEALELVPGVVIREGGEGTPRIDIRGFRTRHVQLFLNGIPVRDTFDGQFDPTRIPANIISEIKVTTGGGSVLYGPGGNGGVIDIITKSGKKGLHGSVGGEAGEGNRRAGTASLSGAGEKADFYAGASVDDREYMRLSDNYEDTAEEDGVQRDNSDRVRASLFGTAGYRFTDQTRMGLTVNYVTGKNGKPPVTNYDSADPFTKKPKYERIDNIRAWHLQTAIDHTTDGPFDFRGWGFFSQSTVAENRYDDATYTTQTKKGSFLQDSKTEIYGGSAQVRARIGQAGSATLGLTGENDTWQADGFTLVSNNNPQDTSEKQDVQFYSAALEYEQTLGQGIELVAGYGHHFQGRDDGKSDDDFSYLIGASYDLTPTTRLRASHARKIRFPSIKQLYDTNGGNADLNTEVSMHYEAGIRQEMPAGMVLNVTGFIIQAKDFIEKDSSDVNSNYEDLRFTGVETDVTARPLDDLMLRFSVAWLDARDASSGSERDQLQHRPEWTISAESRYRFGFGLVAYGVVQHVANQYYYDSDDVAPLEKKKLNNFTIVNVKLSQPFFKNAMSVYIGADNLFDEDYEESYGLPQPGRSVYGGIEYRF